MEMQTAYQLPQEFQHRLALEELKSIFDNLFSVEEYEKALALRNYDASLAAEYLQDHLQEQRFSVTPDTEAESIELGSHSYEGAVDSLSDIREAKKGAFVLEFSRSPQYTGEDIKRLYVTDEALCSIFGFLHPDELARCAMVCKSWAHVESKCKKVYKQACLKEFTNRVSRPINRFPIPFDSTETLWGPEYPESYNTTLEYIQSFKTWKNMWIKRPRIKTYGHYISRTQYWRQGETVPGQTQPAHLVEFYRYIRFFDDFSVICLTTAKKPSLAIPTFNLQHPDVRYGEYAAFKRQVVVHLLAKDCIFTYFFKICSTSQGKWDIMKLERCVTRDLRTLEGNEMITTSDSFPKFYRFRKFK